MKSLESDNLLTLSSKEKKKWALTKDGKSYLAEGTPEYQLFQQIGEQGINKKEINPEILKQGQNHCMKNKWISVDKTGHMTRLVSSIQDTDRTHLQALFSQQPLD